MQRKSTRVARAQRPQTRQQAQQQERPSQANEVKLDLSVLRPRSKFPQYNRFEPLAPTKKDHIIPGTGGSNWAFTFTAPPHTPTTSSEGTSKLASNPCVLDIQKTSQGEIQSAQGRGLARSNTSAISTAVRVAQTSVPSETPGRSHGFTADFLNRKRPMQHHRKHSRFFGPQTNLAMHGPPPPYCNEDAETVSSKQACATCRIEGPEDAGFEHVRAEVEVEGEDEWTILFPVDA